MQKRDTIASVAGSNAYYVLVRCTDALLNSGALRDVSTLLNAGTLLVNFR